MWWKELEKQMVHQNWLLMLGQTRFPFIVLFCCNFGFYFWKPNVRGAAWSPYWLRVTYPVWLRTLQFMQASWWRVMLSLYKPRCRLLAKHAKTIEGLPPPLYYAIARWHALITRRAGLQNLRLQCPTSGEGTHKVFGSALLDCWLVFHNSSYSTTFEGCMLMTIPGTPCYSRGARCSRLIWSYFVA